MSDARFSSPDGDQFLAPSAYIRWAVSKPGLPGRFQILRMRVPAVKVKMVGFLDVAY